MRRQRWLLWLAAVAAIGTVMVMVSTQRLQARDRAAAEALILADGHRMAAALADFFHSRSMLAGEPVGHEMPADDAKALSRLLTSQARRHGYCLVLVTATGHEVHLPGRAHVLRGPLPSSPEDAAVDTLVPREVVAGTLAAEHGHGHGGAARSPVPGTTLSLVTLPPRSMLDGEGTSRAGLYAAGIAPMLLVSAALWRYRPRSSRQSQGDAGPSVGRRADLDASADPARPLAPARPQARVADTSLHDERFRTYVEHGPQGIFVTDANGRLVDANPSACAMVGYSLPEVVRLWLDDLSPPEQAQAHTALLGHVLRRGRGEAELTLRRKDGSTLDVHVRARLLPGDLVLSDCVDVTERNQAEAQMRRLAYYDVLTGLPNRRLLMDRLRRAMAGSSPTGEHGALLLLDLDNFKGLNDSQGHDAGDRLLAEVAQRLGASVPPGATVGRLGGDEYLVIAEALGTEATAASEQAQALAEVVRQALAQPYVLFEGRPAHHGTPSIGLTLFHGQEAAPEMLLKQADLALYQAKSAGGNAWRRFDPRMQAVVEARASIQAALRDALRHEQLSLRYQPQVDREGHVVGAEVLLFWQPPGHDPLEPAGVLALAEEAGLILPLGAWVLAQACDQLARWQHAPDTRRLTLALNVGARQLLQVDFVEQVRSLILRAGIDPKGLRFELDEGLVLDHTDEVIAPMRELKAFGLDFALDHFGTGTSSLSALRRLPLDGVRIDAAFVRDIAPSGNGAALVRAMLGVCHSLGLTVMADGVKTEAQHAFLLQQGCQYFQGDLFGRPVAIEDWT